MTQETLTVLEALAMIIDKFQHTDDPHCRKIVGSIAGLLASSGDRKTLEEFAAMVGKHALKKLYEIQSPEKFEMEMKQIALN